MCLFCELVSQPAKPIYENDLVFVIRDHFPASEGRSLIIPKRHVVRCSEATKAEWAAIGEALKVIQADLNAQYHPEGYTVGINDGAAAGQTVMHMHVHVIPRHVGDTDRPQGGVRGVIPGKQTY